MKSHDQWNNCSEMLIKKDIKANFTSNDIYKWLLAFKFKMQLRITLTANLFLQTTVVYFLWDSVQVLRVL